MIRKIPVLAAIFFFALTPLAAESSFALYFNSNRTHITTVIIYNETGRPISIGVNGGFDWAMDDGESMGDMEEKAASLPSGDLTSLHKSFVTGDCILIESAAEGILLFLTSDRDSLYVYAREGGGEAKVVREN